MNNLKGAKKSREGSSGCLFRKVERQLEILKAKQPELADLETRQPAIRNKLHRYCEL